jgi:hypothetical protein
VRKRIKKYKQGSLPLRKLSAVLAEFSADIQVVFRVNLRSLAVSSGNVLNATPVKKLIIVSV